VRTIWIAVAVCCSMFSGLAGSALSQEPEQFESLLASAQRAQARGDFDIAAGFYKKAVAVRPEIAELRANLGLMYYQTGKDEEAIEAFRQAIRLKPDLFVPHLFLGLDYSRLKRLREAIPYLKQAILLNPADPQAQIALGHAYAASGRTRLAIDAYWRAVQLDPGKADGWYHLGVAYLKQVEADARILLARHEDSGYLHALAGDNFAEQQSFARAAEAYKTTLASQSFPSGTHAAYGFVLLCLHDLPGSEGEFNAELASNPGSLMAKLGFARLQIEQGEAKTAVNEIVEIWKADASFLQANASVFGRGLPAPKIAELQRILQEGRSAGEVPEEVVLLLQSSATGGGITDLSEPSSLAVGNSERSTGRAISNLARRGECADLLASRLPQLQAKDLRQLTSCAYLSGKYQTAVGAAQKLALNPATEAEGLYWETRAEQKLAAEALAHASALDSNSPTLHVLLGDTYRQREYYPDAEQEYRKALAIQPDDTGALLGLSLALIANSHIGEALPLMEAALKKNPADPELNAVMGEILSRQYDFSAAEPYLKRALLEKALNPKPELAPHVHALLGRVYAETNRTQQAINELNMGLADDKDGHIHYQLARLYLKIGDRNSAKKALEASERLQSKGQTKASVASQPGDEIRSQ
jgi:tetratricopeptide (TPR) repeat protein